MFQNVIPNRVLIRLAQTTIETPDMFGSPVISLPTVRVTNLLRPRAPTEMLLDHVKKVMTPKMKGLHVPRMSVSVSLDKNWLHRAISLVNTFKLTGDNVGRLIPTDPLIAANTPHRCIGLLRAPVLPEHWVSHPIFRVNPLLVCHR